MKICTKCKENKELTTFSKCSGNKDGYEYNCKSCRNIDSKQNNAKIEVKEKNKIYQKERREQSTYEEYRQKVYQKHKLKIRQQHKVYDSKSENKVKKLASGSKYRATKLNATPSWLTKDHFKQIESFYERAKELEEATGEKFHVDHIIPLQSKIVSGLHVPWNLQVLTEEENLRKSNKVING